LAEAGVAASATASKTPKRKVDLIITLFHDRWMRCDETALAILSPLMM
jgi:hypothetical protein